MKPTAQQIADQTLLLAASQARPASTAPSLPFPKQDAFVADSSRYIAAQCSRRAGKTNGLARKYWKAMQKYPKSQCIYLALTFDSARDIMWPVLMEMNERHNWGCEFKESTCEMVAPNGSKLRILGADMKNFIKRLKGRKYPAVGIDEAQDFGPHLESLIDDVLTPAMVDYEDSWLAVIGTPGPVPAGYFYKVTQLKQFGFSVHAWTILDNPYVPAAEAFIQDLVARKKWESNHPTLLREWRNMWVEDLEALWVRYKSSVNHFETLPADTYSYIMGVDIGFKDADAIAILAYGTKSATTYLVEEVITHKQGLTELVEQINAMRTKYKPEKIIMDEGGLGKKMAEEMRRRHQIPVVPAEKQRKQETVEFLNDALRMGRFMAKSGSRFAQDSYLVQIDWEKSTPDKVVIKKQPHSDIIDSVLYGFKESPAYVWEAAPKKPDRGTDAWNRAESERMFEAEREGLVKAQQDAAEADYILGGE